MRESLRRGRRGETKENILEREPKEAEEEEEIVVIYQLYGLTTDEVNRVERGMV